MTGSIYCAGLVVRRNGGVSGTTLDIVVTIYAETRSTSSQKDAACI